MPRFPEFFRRNNQPSWDEIVDKTDKMLSKHLEKDLQVYQEIDLLIIDQKKMIKPLRMSLANENGNWQDVMQYSSIISLLENKIKKIRLFPKEEITSVLTTLAEVKRQISSLPISVRLSDGGSTLGSSRPSSVASVYKSSQLAEFKDKRAQVKLDAAKCLQDLEREMEHIQALIQQQRGY